MPPEQEPSEASQIIRKGSGARVEVVDYMRGVAIVSVLLLHTLLVTYHKDELSWKGMFRSFNAEFSFLCFLPLGFGVAGVSLFFVVSGFCIHVSHQASKSWKVFFNRRFFRIYPLYLTTLILFSFFMAPFPSRYQFLTHLFLVHNYSPNTFRTIDGPFWTLAIEVQLYLIYPALLCLCYRLGWKRTMLLLAGLEIAIRTIPWILDVAGYGHFLGYRLSWILQFSPLGFWCSWSLGAYIAEGFLKGGTIPLSKASLYIWIPVAIGSEFFLPLFTCQFLLFSFVAAILLAKMLQGSISIQLMPNVIKRLLRTSGEWSYSLYLLHYPVMVYLFSAYTALIGWCIGPEFYDKLLNPPSTNHYNVLRVGIGLLVLPVIYGISAFFYRFVERPGIAFGKKLLPKTKLTT